MMGLHVWIQGLLTLGEVNCWLSDYHPRKMKPKVSSLSTKIHFRHLKMHFSKTTCFAQAQLRPILCLWSRMSPAASTSPAAPLPAPNTLPTLAGRIFACLPWELVQLKRNFCTQLTCKELWQCNAGQNKGQRWAVLGWVRAKLVRVQLLPTAALRECYKSKAVTSSRTCCASAVSVLAFCPNYHQQQALGKEVKLSARDFLILEWDKKRQWKCLRWRVGCCSLCTLLVHYLLWLSLWHHIT